MYGSIFRMTTRPGQEQAIIDVFDEWERELKPKIKGAVGGYVFKPDSNANQLIGIAIFADKEAYVANADYPEQNEWFLKLRALLESDPEWEDGEYVAGNVG
jgi:quinol monooxygenase YgiN